MLVIDDSNDFTMLIEMYSEREAIEVAVAETAEAGLERLAAEHFDAVLMDFHLPGMNGAEAVRALRQQERHHNRPLVAVFALTDLLDLESSRQMLEAGCTALVGKPLSRQQFLGIAALHRGRTAAIAA